MSPSCHTLSKAFKISTKTTLTSRRRLQANDAYILWTMKKSRYPHDSYGIKPDSFS